MYVVNALLRLRGQKYDYFLKNANLKEKKSIWWRILEEIRLKVSYLIDVSIEYKGTLQSFSFTCTISLYFIPLQKYEFNLNTPNISTVFSSNLHKLSQFFQFFRNANGWQGWQTPPQKNWKLVSPASPNKLAPIKGAAENDDRWHFYILFFYDLPRENR